MSRPSSSQHRLSVGAGGSASANAASSMPVRASASRSHSHSVSLAAVNPSNRINRRKSSTFAPSAAISAAVESAVADGSVPVKRRSSATKAALSFLNDGSSYPGMPSSLPYHASVPEQLSSSSAVIDGPSLSTFQGIEKSKAKARRASDGTHLSKKEKAAAGDLKCEHCGKAYKHGSCLNKHLWEHTPQWQVTSKLLISKHQQVQLLEAASVLVQMNGDGPATTDSDNSSSPAASGSSDRDEYSSAETTPPPHVEVPTAASYRDFKRNSGNSSSAYSRSYQSGMFDSSMPPHPAHGRQWSSSSLSRPTTAATSIAESYRDEDPADLAAAVGLLSCSQGTPTTSPLHLGADDVPPVPPLPAKYAHVWSPPPFPPNQQLQQQQQQQRTAQDVDMYADEEAYREGRSRREDSSEDDDTDRGFSRSHAGPAQYAYQRASGATQQQQQYHQYYPQQQQHHSGMDEDEGVFGKMDA